MDAFYNLVYNNRAYYIINNPLEKDASYYIKFYFTCRKFALK